MVSVLTRIIISYLLLITYSFPVFAFFFPKTLTHGNYHKLPKLPYKFMTTSSNSWNQQKLIKYRKYSSRNTLLKAEQSLDDNWTEYAADAFKLIKDAALPSNGGELISIFISETFAGFISGISFRLVSFAIGDRTSKRDTSLLQGTTTGAYFGLRGAVRNIAEILGIPRPIAVVIAGFTASVLSEEIKIVGRELETMTQGKDKLNTEKLEIIEAQERLEMSSSNQISTDKKPIISIPELSQDLTKWVAYDLLIPSEADSFDAAVCGAASGLIAHSIYEILLPSTRSYFTGEQPFPTSEYLKIANRFLQAGLEAAALFTAYETTILFFKYFLPSELSQALSENFSTYFANFPNLPSF